MKKLYYFCLLLLSFTSLFAQNPIRVQAGQNLQTAIDNADIGSTIQVDGGSFGAITLTKRITLIGAGAFVTNPTIITTIAFNYGSDNSSLIGFKVVDTNGDAVFIYDNVNNILIKNNYIYKIGVGCSLNCGPSNNLSIIHNVITWIHNYTQINNFLIRNNIIGGIVNFKDGTGTISNNTFSLFYLNDSVYILEFGYIMCFLSPSSNIIVKNNIIINPPSGNQTCIASQFVVNYNAFTDWTEPAYNSTNTQGLTRNSIFVGFPTNIIGETLPNQFQLAPNSPARGVGENGADCGAFGGSDPFPTTGTYGPVIYELTAPLSVSSGQTLNVTVKAKVSH